jgi:integrase
MPRQKKTIRCALRKEYGRYQICYAWNPGNWILTPYDTPEEAVLWAKEREQLYKTTGKSDIPTFGSIADGFYDKGSYFRLMKEKKNKVYLEDYYMKRSGLLKNHILPTFRNFYVTEITPYQIDEWSVTLKLAADTKNKCMEVFKEILQSAVSKGCLKTNPMNEVERFGDDSTQREPFTVEELNKLFPADTAEAVAIWGSTLYLAWGLVLRDTGCRPSEALAWAPSDYNTTWGGFPIVKRIRGYSAKIYPGTKGGRRQYRAAILSVVGKRIMTEVLETCETERIFPWRVDQANGFFRLALARAKIPERGPLGTIRTQYCLRHTAVTQTIDIDRELAAEIYGHRTLKNQQRYDHPNEEELFKRVSGSNELLKKRFDTEK